MNIYRFRILLENQDDFHRDIDIPSIDTFETFHNILKNALHLHGNEMSSFYICDQDWNKGKEITLLDMSEDFDDEEPDAIPCVMNATKLDELIKDVHQRVVYEYDFLDPTIVFIELVKILKSVKTSNISVNNTKVKEPVKKKELHEDFFTADIHPDITPPDIEDDSLLDSFDDMIVDDFDLDEDDD